MAMEAPATPAYRLARRALAMAERAIPMRRRTDPAGWAVVARDLRRPATEEVGALNWSARSNAANRRLPPERGEPSPGAGAAGAHPAPAPRRVSRMSGATRRPTRLRNAFC